ncbi:MAG: hypothetical protein C0404_01595 [Verrucomicrobia bacterium]|nr:hypothetical protein [Verrucomicrobiota bacterium]
MMNQCCICSKDLPNKYAVAGRCRKTGCDNAFCSLHWNRSNRQCREHGYEETRQEDRPALDKGLPGGAADTPGAGGDNSKENKMPDDNTPQKQADPAKARKVMNDALVLVKKLGLGALDLLKKLKKDKSPQAMMATVDTSLAANKTRRESIEDRVEKLYGEICAKKAAYQKAAPARRSILEADLKSKLAEYKAVERELKVLFENERILSQVKGRIYEMQAYDMAGVSENLIDDVAMDIESKVDEAEGRVDASRDLERAGKRRDRESDRDAFNEDLDAFGSEEKPSAFAKELDAFGGEEKPAAGSATDRKAAEKDEEP